MSKKGKVLIEHNKGLTVAEISEVTGFGISTVRWAINSSGLKANQKSPGKELDSMFQSFILGSILGDGCIQKDNRLSIAHGIKQKEYIEHKWEFLNSYDLAGKLSKNKIVNERYKNGFVEEHRFKSLTTDKMSGFRDFYYQNGNKLVPNETFLTEYLTPFALAIWYMDDGSVCNYNVEFNSQSFSKAECNSLRYVLLEKHNIKTTLKPSENIITVRAASLMLFFSIIQHFIVDSMKYKLKTLKGPV